VNRPPVGSQLIPNTPDCTDCADWTLAREHNILNYLLTGHVSPSWLSWSSRCVFGRLVFRLQTGCADWRECGRLPHRGGRPRVARKTPPKGINR